MQYSKALPVGLYSIIIGASFGVLATADEELTVMQPLEVIEVHAQRRLQDIYDVTVAVTIVDGEYLQQRQLKDSVELAALSPNFTASNAAAEGTTPALTMRGVGMFDYNTSTISPIAIYSDDIVSGGASFLSSQLYDLARIEILRGPQGTLFGRNTTGGAVLLMSAMPEAEFGGYIRTSVAQQQHYRTQGAINTPINDDTALRFAFNWQDYQYSMKNIMPGAPTAGMEQASFRLLLSSRWQDWELLFRLSSEHWQGVPKPVYNAGVFSDLAAAELCPPGLVGSRQCVDAFGLSVPSDDYWTTAANTFDKRNRTDSWSGSIHVSREFSPQFTVKSVSAYKSFNRTHLWDADGPGQFIEGRLGSNSDFFSQELTFYWEQGTRFWTAGLFYLQEELIQNNSLDLFRDFRAVPELAAVPAQFFYANSLKNKSVAGYGQLEQPLSSRLTLTAGLRLTDESTRYRARSDLDTVAFYLPQLWDLNGEVADTQWTGKLALNQRLTQQHMLYYSYSRGYKSGGYNGGFATSPEEAANSAYGPEYLDAFEVGSRWRSANDQLRWDMAAFYYDYQDQQTFVNFSSGVAPYHVLKNAGDGKIFGFESQWRYQPNQQLELRLALGYIPTAKLGEYREGEMFVANSRLPFTPKWTLGAAMQYQQSLSRGRLLWQLGVDYQSSVFFDQYESDYTRQAGYRLWHGRLGWQLTADLELAIWGKNIFNQQYTELKFDSIAALGAITQLRGEARQLGIELSYQF
ncbi:TonB-dependent receptor [Arsukibacterium ikkense]|nr:TonB-dependent receptor [Arsukibacterium ikkense]